MSNWLKPNLLSGLLAAILLCIWVSEHRANVQLASENSDLRQQLSEAVRPEVRNSPLPETPAVEAATQALPPGESAELLRLRGEVARLRQEKSQSPGEARSAAVVSQVPTATSPVLPTENTISLEAQMRAEGKHWVQTHEAVTVGGLVQDKVIGRPGKPFNSGSVGKVISINENGGDQVAVVDFGNYTRSYHVSELAAVSDSAAADSVEGTLRAQGTQWTKVDGVVASGDWVVDILDGRHDQPDGRGSIGKVISVSAEENKPPAAMIDFGRGYTIGLNLSEISKVSFVTR